MKARSALVLRSMILLVLILILVWLPWFDSLGKAPESLVLSSADLALTCLLASIGALALVGLHLLLQLRRRG